MKAAIYGAGSLGTILGAYITKNNGQIDLINRNAAHIAALKKKGAQIVGKVNFTVPVNAMTPQEMHDKYDLIILMTKQLDNENIVKSLVPFMDDDCIICTMQNGLPELSVSNIIGEDRVMGCTVAWGATMQAPGISELTSEPDSMSFGLGRMNGKKDKKLEEVKSLLELMCPVDIEDNFMGVRWSKLLINAAFSGMSAVCGSTFGEAANNKKSRAIILSIIKEVIDVATANGITITPVQGHDVVKLLYYKNALKKQLSFMLIPIVIKKHSSLRASMLQDLEKGKLTEVDAINGVVCAYGDKAGIDTPYNDKVCEIIHGIEQGKLKSSFDNVKLF